MKVLFFSGFFDEYKIQKNGIYLKYFITPYIYTVIWSI